MDFDELMASVQEMDDIIKRKRIMDKVEAVAKVNNVFEYQYDSDQYQVADYWRVLDMKPRQRSRRL